MKSSSKQTASLPDDSQEDSVKGKRQQQAFIASDRYDRNRMRLNESRIDRLTAAQFRLSNTVLNFERRFQAITDEAIRESQAKADAELKVAADTINKKVEGLNGELDKKVLEARNKVIEPLAIFVGLFTFVSIGFQIFAQVKEYILWMPLLSLVLGGIIIFAGLIIHASSMNADATERRKYTFAIIGIGIAIIVFAGLYYHEAVNILRTQDSKDCVIVKVNEKDASESTYCKHPR